MNSGTLILRSLSYFRAAHAALLAGMILVVAVVTGALILGDSVRDSLRDLADRRRGNYETLVTAPQFFSQSLADRAKQISGRTYAAGLALTGRARAERTALSAGAQLFAVPPVLRIVPHYAQITRTLAESLQVRVGDILLITLPTASTPPDAVLSHRDRSALGSLRVTIDRILDERSEDDHEAFFAWFDLHPTQRPPAAIWLNITELQEALQAEIPAPDRIPSSPANILLVERLPAKSAAPKSPPAATPEFPPPAALMLEDYGLALTPASESSTELILRSGNIYIPPTIAKSLHPYKAVGQEVYTLLLDTVSADRSQTRPAPALSYVVAAGITGKGDLGLKDDELAVNQWTADQLQLQVGETLKVSPYRLQADAVTPAPPVSFKLARILPMTGIGADPTLTPAFHGLTDADTIAGWHPPAGFPFARARVTPADEAYWSAHKAAPKLFFNLLTAQRLVKPETTLTPTGNSNGELTSLRLPPTAAPADTLERDLLKSLTPQAAGFAHRPFAPDTPANTDFASLFLGLSGFLLIAAILLIVLLFRLAVEQRARQMGLLGALGFSPIRIGRIILAEGAIVALLGAIVGTPVAVGYTHLLVKGLATWWFGAIGTHAITVHVQNSTLAIGGAISFVAALLALAFTARRLSRQSPLAQLTGNQPSPHSPATAFEGNAGPHRKPSAARLANGLLPLALLIIFVLAPLLNAPMGFLVSGFLLLVLAILLLTRLPATSRRPRQSLASIAAAGILRQRTRAILCVALMAAASFLLTSVTAFESTPTTPTAPPSPTGGYQLILTTQIPLPADPQTPAGRKLLGIPEDPLFAATCFTSLCVQPGDDISCLNMTRPTSATLVGAPPDLLARLAVTKRTPPPAGAIPAAVDQQTAQYILHAGLGERLPETTIDRPVIISTLLSDSIFQSYALIPEADFHQAFPAVTRPSLFLVDCPPDDVPALRDLLRRRLDDFGITIETTTERLAAYHAVADSYIAAFQFLGALALVVGTLGLVVVLARNVIQRRAELALLQALGFSRGRITLMLVIEHGILLLLGLALGIAAALVATLPQFRQVHALPVAAATGTILLTGLLALTLAAHLATRRLTPAALRQE